MFLVAVKRLFVSGLGLRLAFIVTGHLVEGWRERRLMALTPSNHRRLPPGAPLVRVSSNKEVRRVEAAM